MSKNDKLIIPVLTVQVSRKKIPVPAKLARIAALILVGAVSFLWLYEPQNDVQLAYMVYFNIKWMDVFLHTLFASALLFSVSCLICELIGYVKRRFVAFSTLVCVLLTVASAWWRWRFSLSADDSLFEYLPNKICLWLIAFAAVFLFGKFVLFKKPREEQEE